MSQQVNIEKHLMQLGQLLQQHQRTLVVAESCTGGMLAARITDHAGCSAWFRGGFVTYQTRTKTQMLGVPATLLQQHPVVSKPVALAMAEHSLAVTKADYAVAVTGLAGPQGDNSGVAVGTLWIGWGDRRKKHYWAQQHHLHGDRDAFRVTTCELALEGLCQYLANQS